MSSRRHPVPVSMFAKVDESRRRIMSAIRSKDTKPEKLVRSALHSDGYRFRTNYAQLPGRPDIVFTKRRVAIFVHGCFWHLHEGCDRWHFPRTREEYWTAKLTGNAERDQKNLRRLKCDGWRTVVIWECEPRSKWLWRIKRILGPAKMAAKARRGLS
jgi:DNA mismatch endonuclease (patch repair protein)